MDEPLTLKHAITLRPIMEASGGTIYINPSQIAAVYEDPKSKSDPPLVIIAMSSGFEIRLKGPVEKALRYLDVVEVRRGMDPRHR